jgi:hypothetical protein
MPVRPRKMRVTQCDRRVLTVMIIATNASSSLGEHSNDLGSQSLKFVPNGLLTISGTTAIANEEVQVPSSSMLIESLILCSHTYFDSTASKGLSFVSNGLLSSRPSESNSDVGQFFLNVTLTAS